MTVFEPDLEERWPEGLKVPETTVQVSKGLAAKVRISMRSLSNKDVILPRRKKLGSLKLIRSVTTLGPAKQRA